MSNEIMKYSEFSKMTLYPLRIENRWALFYRAYQHIRYGL